MKKVMIVIIGVLVFILLGLGIYFLFIRGNTIKENSISLSETELHLEVNEKKKLNVTFDPVDTTKQAITWTSSDDKIVSVNSIGIIEALQEGNVTITAKSLNGKTASCQVEVKPLVIPVESIVLKQSEVELEMDESIKITPVINPSNATNNTLVWSSSDEKVVTVNEGIITAVGAGEANVKVSTTDESIGTVVKVTVKDIALELSKSEVELEVSQSVIVDAKISPTKGEVKWTSGDSSIASVENGKITAHKIGSTSISCEYRGKIATVPVKVYEYFDIGLFWGQSNMVGYASESNKNILKNVDSDIVNNTKSYSRVVVDMPKNVAFEYKVSGNKLYDISDNPTTFGESLYYNKGNLSPKSDKGNNIQQSRGTNMIPYFAKEYYEQTNHKLIVAFAASGGKSINKFLPDSTTNLYKIMTTKFKKAEEYILNQNSYYRVRNKFYVVYQGEADAVTSLASYYERDYSTVHNNLIKDLNLSLGAMVYLVRGDYSYNNTYVQKVREQQKKLVSENNNLIMGTDFPYTELSSGNTSILCPDSNKIHINAAGLSQIGRDIAKSIVKSGRIKK